MLYDFMKWFSHFSFTIEARNQNKADTPKIGEFAIAAAESVMTPQSVQNCLSVIVQTYYKDKFVPVLLFGL